jgi:hypothetical protein
MITAESSARKALGKRRVSLPGKLAAFGTDVARTRQNSSVFVGSRRDSNPAEAVI